MNTSVPELWEWAEFYCPWCYITAVRLDRIAAEYEGRVRVRMRAFPLELHGDAAPRDILEQEWWIAALQEPAAPFGPMADDANWPTTTLPAFDAAWCANQLGDAVGRDYDLRVRRAFFAEGRNIGDPAVLLAIAEEAGLDMDAFRQLFESDRPRAAILAEGQEGRERFRVRGTPTLTMENGDRLRPPMAYPKLEDRKIVEMQPLTCYGEGCDPAIRQLFETVIERHAAAGAGG